MQDLQVIDILPQMITLSEAYIQASRLTCSNADNQKQIFVDMSRAGGHIVGPQLSIIAHLFTAPFKGETRHTLLTSVVLQVE